MPAGAGTQEMARYVQSGALEAGITGHDWVVETRADVLELAELAHARERLARVKWVLAVPEEFGGGRAERPGRQGDRDGGCRDYAELPGEARCDGAGGVFVGNTTEVKSAGACGYDREEVTETGIVVAGERLRILDTVLESATVFIMNRKSELQIPAKREKAENLVLMLQGAIAAATRVGLMLNVRRENLDAVLAALPALKNPTISSA